MNLTNTKIIASANALQVLSQVALPVKTSFKVAKAAKSISSAIALVQSEREKLIEKHAQKDEAGVRKVNPDYTVPLVDPKAFQADEAELLAIEQAVEFEPATLDELGQVSIPPAVFMDLDWLFA